MKRLLAVLMFALLALCPLSGLWAQSTTGFHVVSQVLTRASSGVNAQIVPYATVSVTNTGTGGTATIYSDPLLSAQITPAVVTADSGGNYSFYVPLNYCITETITAPGFGTQTIPNVCQNSNSATGVTSINSQAGAFTFSGGGVSCSGTNCVFSSGSACSPNTLANGCTGATTAAGALANLYQPLNAKACGATGNGTTDDTAAINVCIGLVNAQGAGSIYFPTGGYKVTSTLTTVTVPIRLYGDGSCSNDATECLSKILWTGGSHDVFLLTSEHVESQNLGFINASSGTPSAGAAIDFCYSGSYQFPDFQVRDDYFADFYTGFSACMAEDGDFSNNRVLDAYYDGLVLGTGTTTNSGDQHIQGNTFTACGSSAYAAIDGEGVNPGIVQDNNINIGPMPNPGCNGSLFQYGVHAYLGGAYQIVDNYITGASVAPIYETNVGGAGVISGNWLDQRDACGPSIIIDGYVNKGLLGSNTIANIVGGSCWNIPYGILFSNSGSDSNVLVMAQTLAGVTAAQSGLLINSANGNRDYSLVATPQTPFDINAPNFYPGYQSLTISGGSGLTVSIVASAGVITACSTPSGGTGYSTGELVTVGGGTAGYCQITNQAGGVPSAVVLWGAGGSGYSTASGASTTFYGLGINWNNGGDVYVTVNASGTVLQTGSGGTSGATGTYTMHFYDPSGGHTVAFGSGWYNAGPIGTNTWNTPVYGQFIQQCTTVAGGIQCYVASPYSVSPFATNQTAPNWITKWYLTSPVSGGSVALDMNNGGFQELLLTGDTTITAVTNWTNGMPLYLMIEQDATGGHTLTVPGSWQNSAAIESSVPSGVNQRLFVFEEIDTGGGITGFPAVSGGGVSAFSGGLGASYQDVTEIAAPSNPASGNDRLYLDSTSHQLTCLTTGGGNCMPSGSAGAFSGIGSGTNTAAAMTVGSGASLGTTGTGTISANQLLAVPFCTGFTPTNSQYVQYTTGGTPNPCYSAASPSGSGNTTSTTLTTYYLDEANGANSIISSPFYDANPASTPTKFAGASAILLASDATYTDWISMIGNTTLPSLATHTFNLLAPNSATVTAYGWQFPSATNSAAGIVHVGAESGNVSQLTVSAVALTDFATQGADTFLANMTASTAQPTAVAFPTTIHGVILGAGTAAGPSITAAGAVDTVLLGEGASADPLFGTVTSAYVDSSVVTDASHTTTTAQQVAVSTGTAGGVKFIDYPAPFSVPAANCVSGSGGSAWNTTLVAGCRAGTYNLGGFLPFADSNTGQFQLTLPADWDSSSSSYARLNFTTGANTSGTIIFTVALSCFAANNSATDDQAFQTAQTFSTITAAHANYANSVVLTLNSTSLTGCVAGGGMLVKITRSTDTAASIVPVTGATITLPRLLVLQAE